MKILSILDLKKDMKLIQQMPSGNIRTLTVLYDANNKGASCITQLGLSVHIKPSQLDTIKQF